MSNIETEYKGHPVLIGDHKDFRYNEKHLKNNLELMEAAVKRHNKVLSHRGYPYAER